MECWTKINLRKIELLVISTFRINERKIIIGLTDEFGFEVKCENVSEIVSAYDFCDR